MNKLSAVFFSLFIALSLSLGGVQVAEAKRFGGARSFGSKPSYYRPYNRQSGNTQRSAKQQQAERQNQTARQQLNRRGGLMGMLGGLALGGLLGSLFFGGAFQGLNFMDLLIFGGIAWLLYKLFVSKNQRPNADFSYNRNQYNSGSTFNDSDNKPAAGFDTDVLFKKNQGGASENRNAHLVDADFDEPSIPTDFNRDAFLAGAKAAFKQLQAAWDAKDLAAIRSLTTDKVFAEIQEQIQSDTPQNVTEILKVEAELLDYREIGSELEAVVLFDTVLREDRSQQAEQIREIWHFVKPVNSNQKTWFLDGIQQMQ